MADKKKTVRPGPNFEVLHLMPPWDIGDVLPPRAFKEYPARHIELGALKHTHDEPTVEVKPAEVAIAGKPASEINQDDYDELLAENGRLVFELNAANGKLGAAESRAAKAEAEIREAKESFKGLETELAKRGDTISELNMEVNSLRMQRPKTEAEIEDKQPPAPPEDPHTAPPAQTKANTGKVPKLQEKK